CASPATPDIFPLSLHDALPISIEVRVLLECMQPGASITLAGDTQQQLVEHSGFSSWPTFFRDVGLEGVEVETLRVSYRSSLQVIDRKSTRLNSSHVKISYAVFC